MANYNQVSLGSSGSDVKTLQELLNQNGANLSVDGIFGAKTQQAVKDYQKAKGLAVDGIVGKNTWGALTTAQPAQPAQTAPEVPDYSAYQYDPSTNERYNYANTMLEQAQQNISTPTYDYDAVQAAYDKIVNRDKFQYDLNGDALYQQYKDQYTTQGKMAMMDAMGQAAALTGGYGSSYAQGAGQQAFQGYLQQLNEVIPELYGMAYDQYQQEGQNLLNQYAMTKEMADTKYGIAQDEQNAAWQAMNYWQSVSDSEHDKGFNNWYTAQQLGTAADDRKYERQQDDKNYLVSLISAGYNPTDAELAAAGMTRSQADQLVSAYKQQVANSVGDAAVTTKIIDYKGMGYSSYNEMAAALDELASAKGDEVLWNELKKYAKYGYLDEETAKDLYFDYSKGEQEETGEEKTGNVVGYSASFMTPDEWKRRTGSYAGYEAWLKQQAIYE